MPDWETTVDNMKEWIDWVDSKYAAANKVNARVMLAVTLKEDGRMIGMVGIGNKKEVDNEIEIAYFISEKYSNNGYMSEASKAMAEWAFDIMDLDYLIAIVEPGNYPSQRVVEKCSFVKLETRMILNSGENEEKPFYYYRLYNNDAHKTAKPGSF
jgi:RimJ/RimL family protein N-acetyltransferase